MKKHDWRFCESSLGECPTINVWGGVLVRRNCQEPSGKWANLSVISYRDELEINITATGLMRVFRAGKELK